jgi:hypothetical protein
MKERSPNDHQEHRATPLDAGALPADLAAFLSTQRLACLLVGTDRGSAMVIKAPADEIESVRGPVPVLLRHELYRHPTSPVIRMLLRLYDRPPTTLTFESFINVDDEGQRADYGELTRQDELDLHFYDETLAHRLAKRVANPAREHVLQVLITALRLRARIPDDRFDFDQAKADVIARTSI